MSDGRNVAGYHAAFLRDPQACNGCALCAEMCPESAITIYRKTKKPTKGDKSVSDTTTGQGE